MAMPSTTPKLKGFRSFINMSDSLWSHDLCSLKLQHPTVVRWQLELASPEDSTELEVQEWPWSQLSAGVTMDVLIGWSGLFTIGSSFQREGVLGRKPVSRVVDSKPGDLLTHRNRNYVMHEWREVRVSIRGHLWKLAQTCTSEAGPRLWLIIYIWVVLFFLITTPFPSAFPKVKC